MPLTEVNITCPHAHAILVRITAEGLTARCQHCTMGEHSLTWQEVDTRRAAVTPAEPAPEPLIGVSPIDNPKKRYRNPDRTRKPGER